MLLLTVKKFWTSKMYTGTPKFKNVMIKCSPQIRKHIMKDNDGYVYVGLSRCKSFDHCFITQCYHCYKFNHVAGEYPDKDMPATCGKCAVRPKNKDCNRNSETHFVINFLPKTPQNDSKDSKKKSCI